EVREGRDPEQGEAFLGGLEEGWAARAIGSAYLGNESMQKQGLDRPIAVHASRVRDLGTGRRLAVGEHCKRFPRRWREARGLAGLEEAPHRKGCLRGRDESQSVFVLLEHQPRQPPATYTRDHAGQLLARDAQRSLQRALFNRLAGHEQNRHELRRQCLAFGRTVAHAYLQSRPRTSRIAMTARAPNESRAPKRRDRGSYHNSTR